MNDDNGTNGTDRNEVERRRQEMKSKEGWTRTNRPEFRRLFKRAKERIHSYFRSQDTETERTDEERNTDSGRSR